MKNNSFKYTFYFGLLIILVLSGLIVSVSINIYNSINNKILTKPKKEETTVIELPSNSPEKEIIHDTVYLEKPTIKVIDTQKQKKVTYQSPQIIKVDTSLSGDSIK